MSASASFRGRGLRPRTKLPPTPDQGHTPSIPPRLNLLHDFCPAPLGSALVSCTEAAGSEFGRHMVVRRALDDEERLKRVLPLETPAVSVGGPALRQPARTNCPGHHRPSIRLLRQGWRARTDCLPRLAV
jgi:hypothetical protein